MHDSSAKSMLSARMEPVVIGLVVMALEAGGMAGAETVVTSRDMDAEGG
jgi:hypothetical protein